MKTTTLFGRPCGSKIQTWSAPLPNGPWRPTRGGEVDDAEPQPAARSASSARRRDRRNVVRRTGRDACSDDRFQSPRSFIVAGRGSATPR